MTDELEAEGGRIHRGRNPLEVPANVKRLVRRQVLAKIAQRGLQLRWPVSPEDEIGLFGKADELIRGKADLSIGTPDERSY